MRSIEEIHQASRKINSFDADFSANLRNLLSDGGTLLQLWGALLEQRDGFAEGLTRIELFTDEGRMRAVRQQALVVAMDQVFAVIYNLANQEKQDVEADQNAA